MCIHLLGNCLHVRLQQEVVNRTASKACTERTRGRWTA